jgi:ribosomal protein L29
MKKTDFTEKTTPELVKLLKEQREELRGIRFGAAGSRMKDAHAGRKVRRDIARILTALTAKKA